MAKTPRRDPAVLAREYIYNSEIPPISINALAEKYGYAVSHIADMARKGQGLTQPKGGSIKSWYDARKEVRAMVGEKVLSALTDDWAAAEAVLRDRMLQTAVRMLDKFDEGLDAGTIKITARDLPTIIGTIRMSLGDIAAVNANRQDTPLIDPQQIELDPEKYAETLPMLKQLLSGKATNGTDHTDAGDGTVEGPAPGDAAPSPEGAVAD